MIAIGRAAPVLVSVVVSISIVTSLPIDGLVTFKLQSAADDSSSRVNVTNVKLEAVILPLFAIKLNGIDVPANSASLG